MYFSFISRQKYPVILIENLVSWSIEKRSNTLRYDEDKQRIPKHPKVPKNLLREKTCKRILSNLKLHVQVKIRLSAPSPSKRMQAPDSIGKKK